ncbi:bifunctional Delta(1)-pyrroline-2-carboxylate/Delta(1)-piperideine-2-carboxylate reductase [Paraburkholderia metrosideri]|jgi:1-piperideine-2-carboxylate/1-pyrroline-2-carboxylate reductase [NAD(P)H]|uniref:Delta(1)-pyrroline-2-carboxylate reductase 1 n=1 Tax=Paraburkholderia metrosideri TaxID=580937 RepID=A0ABN7IGT1_9BURK|nr:bifunctional Delta(1)-pyrroline-2-carboxylate/Delta(1)-piperideine-2-carboxylate reductase [Paraburkholderia metrosideri]CAD6559309.1 Delta(1)-pyrroline-2-carboxylate reductase 1 [Paraburkholderia metrosideri]
MTAVITRNFDAQATAELLDYPALVQGLRQTVLEYGAGKIVSPERMVVPLQEGGLMLSMPASAADIAIHKLVNVCPSNGKIRLPTIHGQVVAYDSHTGETLFVLDGPTVTGRRTAAVTVLGIQTLHGTAPRELVLIGTGKQAANHAEALAAIFPDARLYVKSRSRESAQAFVERMQSAAPNLVVLDSDAIPDSVEVVITLTTSKSPVYNESARAGRLVIGVGAFTPDAAEVSQTTIDGSFLIVDDPVGAKHEAGDLIQANVDWKAVSALADAIAGRLTVEAPIFFKSVGCAAWDLAACRVVRQALAGR